MTCVRHILVLLLLLAVGYCGVGGACGAEHVDSRSAMGETSSGPSVDTPDECDHCPFCTGGLAVVAHFLPPAAMTATTPLHLPDPQPPRELRLAAFHPPRA